MPVHLLHLTAVCLVFLGRFEAKFIRYRLRQLQLWIDRMCRHPVVAQSEVFLHFISCNEDKVCLDASYSPKLVYCRHSGTQWWFIVWNNNLSAFAQMCPILSVTFLFLMQGIWQNVPCCWPWNVKSAIQLISTHLAVNTDCELWMTLDIFTRMQSSWGCVQVDVFIFIDIFPHQDGGNSSLENVCFPKRKPVEAL